MLRFPDVNTCGFSNYIFISERECSVFFRKNRFWTVILKPLNGYAPFFSAILGVWGKNERIYSVFYALFKPISAIIVGG